MGRRIGLAIAAFIADHGSKAVTGLHAMTTSVTGAGLIGTAFAQNAITRGEKVVFVDPEPRADFLKLKLGEKGYALARLDVRHLPNLIATIQQHGADTVVHTAGLIGNRVQQSLSAGFDI